MTDMDLDAIAADVELAKRSGEMARHVALDHTPELIARIRELEAENRQVDEELGEAHSDHNDIVEACYRTGITASADDPLPYPIQVLLTLSYRIKGLESQVADVSQMAGIIHAHRFDPDRQGDQEHIDWLASFGETLTNKPDLFYAGIEYAVKRIREALAGTETTQ